MAYLFGLNLADRTVTGILPDHSATPPRLSHVPAAEDCDKSNGFLISVEPAPVLGQREARVLHLTGDMDGWRAAGHPIEGGGTTPES